MRPTTTIYGHVLTLETAPDRGTLERWWTSISVTRQEKPAAFADTMPTDLDAFLSSGIVLALITAEAAFSCVAAVWLHDHDAATETWWAGCWVHCAFRGPMGLAALRLGLVCAEAHGVPHLLVAIHQANRASQRLILGRAGLGFTRVCVWPAFAPFQGQLASCVLGCWRPADRLLTLQVARQRALRLAAAGE